MYADNKSFLASEEIITFNDASGRLMALRPDVTLSIVRGVSDGGGLKKLYYNENVYRPDGEGREFRERMQVGLECIGDIDSYTIAEVIMLALESIKTLGDSVCLDISHMGFIGGLLESVDLSVGSKSALLRLMGQKNMPELIRFCSECGLDDEFCNRIVKLSLTYGSIDDVIEEFSALSVNERTETALMELRELRNVLCEFEIHEEIKLDFSIINDLNYYSGIIFQGYIEGVPQKVLSGGRYDELLRKFGKRSGAAGFAVYLDLLERLNPPKGNAFVDVLLLYGEENPSDIARAVKGLTDSGSTVSARKELSGNVEYRTLMRIADGRLETIEKKD